MSAKPMDPGINREKLAPLAPNPGRYPIMQGLTPKQQVALLCRVLFKEGYNDHIAGHITYRQDDGTLPVNPFPVPVGGDGATRNPAGSAGAGVSA